MQLPTFYTIQQVADRLGVKKQRLRDHVGRCRVGRRACRSIILTDDDVQKRSVSLGLCYALDADADLREALRLATEKRAKKKRPVG